MSSEAASSSSEELSLFSSYPLSLPASIRKDIESCTSVGEARLLVEKRLKKRGDGGERLLDWLRCGVYYLNSFLRLNFIGPDHDVDWLPKFATDPYTERAIVDSDLACDFDCAYPLCRRPFLLLFPKWLFIEQVDLLCGLFPTTVWWALRTLWTWQKLFAFEKVAIKTAVLEAIQDESNVAKLLQSLSPELQVCFWTECSYIYSFYNKQKAALQTISRSLELCGVQVHTKGVLGLRTRFQSKAIAQLTLDVKSLGTEAETNCVHSVNEKEVPMNLGLGDDTLLNVVKFSSEEPDSNKTDSALFQLALLAKLNFVRTFNPKTCLLEEELDAYLDKLLRKPRSYAIQFVALYRRCDVESSRRRRVERALKQVEELIKRTSADEPVFESRSVFMYSVNPPPIWDQHRLLAKLLLMTGCTNEALKMYVDLKDWENVIKCYKVLGMLDRAETLVREQLDVRRTPTLLCHLGDITSNDQFYEEAWELSKHRCARAQSSLADLCMARGRFDQAVIAFKKSMELQPLQLKAWYHLGYCALQLKDYALAASAYQRCTAIEPDNFEAWNNLAAAYVELKQYERAFIILNEALKHDYENWKVWDNFVLIAMRSHHFQEAIGGIHRMLDLRGKYTDYQILSCLIAACCDKTADFADGTAPPRKDELLKLFGHLTSSKPDDDRLWRLYAELCDPETMKLDDSFVTVLEKYGNLRHKAYQMSVRRKDWVQNEADLFLVISDVTKLADAHLKLASLVEGDKAKQLRNTARLNVKSVLQRISLVYGHDGFPSQFSSADELNKSLLDLKAVLSCFESGE